MNNTKNKLMYITFAMFVLLVFSFSIVSFFSNGSLAEITYTKWDGITVGTDFASGNGTEANPYVINDGNQLMYFKKVLEEQDEEYVDKYYKLGANIDLDNHYITPFATFKGHLDGNGNFISNINMTSSYDIDNSECYGLFSNLEDASIKNLNISNFNIEPVQNSKMLFVGGLAGFITGDSDIYNVSVSRVTINLANTKSIAGSGIGLLTGSIDEIKSIKNIFVDGKISSKYNTNVAIVSSNLITNITNVVYRVDTSLELEEFNYIEEGITSEYVIKMSGENKLVYEDEEYSVTTALDLFNRDLKDLVWKYDSENLFYVGVEDKKPVNKPTSFGFNPRTITLHDSGRSGDTLYVNDLESDYNDFMGRNYTGKTDGVIPDGTNLNLYTNTNLAKVYISYDGEDINDSSAVGYVSLDEQVSKFIYYKYYPIQGSGSNKYIEIPLIDSPYADRPNDKAFNGWVTNYPNATITLDTDVYVRYLKVPIASNYDGDVVNINVQASWTEATKVTGNNQSSLKSRGMVPITNKTPVYAPGITFPEVYVRRTINSTTNQSGVPYPAGAVNQNRQSLENSSCTPYWDRRQGWVAQDCTYYLRVYEYTTETVYTLRNNGNPQVYNGTLPQPVSYNYSYLINIGDSVAGYFEKKSLSNGQSQVGYYNSIGSQLSGTCSGTCEVYDLVQDLNTTLASGDEQYYYLVTRDTNIMLITSDTTAFTISKPCTVTGMDNGTLYSNRRITNSNNYLMLNEDARIEYMYFYNRTARSTQLTNSGLSNNTVAIIANYHNLKIGRGITDARYVAATSVFGGSAGGITTTVGSSSAPERYTTIVESGRYSNIYGTETKQYSGNLYLDGQLILGCDYDRITNANNTNLDVYYSVQGAAGGTLRSSSEQGNLYTIYVKSGKFGTSKYDPFTGIYVGGRGGTVYATRTIVVEGGDIYVLVGGLGTSSTRTNQNDTFMNLKGGIIDVVFGGAGSAETYGNRIINLTGSTVRSSVFGGSNGYAISGYSSETGILNGSTFVYVGGTATVGVTGTSTAFGQGIGNVFGIGNGNNSRDDIGTALNSTVLIDGGTINGDVYGGGNFGAVGLNASGTTNTKIILKSGDVKGSVYGGGNNNGAGDSSVVSNINITMDGDCTVSDSIYGGSNAKGTIYGNVNINLVNGTVTKSVYGGGEGGRVTSGTGRTNGTAVTRNVTVNVGDATNTTSATSLKIGENVYGGSAFGTVNGNYNSNSTSNYTTTVNVNKGTVTGSVFGGAKGGTYNNRTFTPNVWGDVTVNINGGNITAVYGGNDQMGSPAKGDVVYLKGGTIGNVYGGGNNTGQTTTNVYLQGSTVTSNIYGGSNNSGNVTTTHVTATSGSVANIYGGNNLGGTVTTTNVDFNGATISGDIYGGGNQASCTTTNVTITSGTVNDVYGGGYAAGVTSGTNVTVLSGTADQVFGGSNSNGTVNQTRVVIGVNTGTNGNININEVYGGNNVDGSVGDSYVFTYAGDVGSVFGGGNKIGVTNTNVKILGGNITDVYGGANEQGNVTNSDVQVGNNSNTVNVGSVYGGNNEGGITSNPKVTIDKATVNAVYGGGNQANTGTTTVIVKHGSEIGVLYGGGNQAQVNGNTSVDIDDSTITGNVYGGGNQGVVTGNTVLRITNGEINGSAYAGGNGSTAVVKGNSSIYIDGDSVIGTDQEIGKPATGSVFGSGNAAATGEVSPATSKANVYITGGTIYGNVYGGANTSVVYGNTNVYLGTEAMPSGVTLTEADLHIYGTVFAGGEANASGSDIYDFSFVSVTDDAQIIIDGKDYGTHSHDFIVNGSFFGSGNNSVIADTATSTIYIRNLGTRDHINESVSIQRANKVVIDNSCLELSGAIDSTNEYQTYKYSISRVPDFTIKNGTMLLLRENANLLETFKSMVGEDGQEVKADVDIDDESKTVTRTVDNRLYMLANKALNVATSQDATVPGEVWGMTFFGMYTGTGHNPNFGVYEDSYNYGDTTESTNYIFAGSYVKGAHVTDHDIEVDGFYTNVNANDTYTELKTQYITPHPNSADYYIWSIGVNTINYEFNLSASKYSSLGTYNLVMDDFGTGSTTFNVLDFDAADLEDGISLVDSNNVPKVAYDATTANSTFGISMKAETREWTSYGTTKLLSVNNGDYTGTETYKTDTQSIAPSLMFYFYHAKNITYTGDLGTVVLTLQALTPRNAIEFNEQLVTITINLDAIEFDMDDAYDASITYGKKYDMPSATAVNITNRSQFSAYFSMVASPESFKKFYGDDGDNYHAIVSDYALPVGAEITMIDTSVDGEPKEYYYTVDATNYAQKTQQLQTDHEVTYLLSDFIAMDSTTTTNTYDDETMNQIYYNSTYNLVVEEFMFIVDLKNCTNTGENKGNTFLFELRNNEDRTMYYVLAPRQEHMVYSTYDSANSTLTETVNMGSFVYQDIDNNVTLTTAVTYNVTDGRESIIDTNYESNAMGINLEIIDHSGNTVSSSLLTGTSIHLGNQDYFADADGIFRIKLAGKVSNLTNNMVFKTDKLLPAGNYTFRFSLFSSSDGMHAPANPVVTDKNVTVVATTSSIVVNGVDENKVVDGALALNELGNNHNAYTVKYTSTLNNPNIRVSLYKRTTNDSEDTTYNEVDITSLFDVNLSSPNHPQSLYEKQITLSSSPISIDWDFQSSLTSGSYKLTFKLYDSDTLIDSDYEMIIVKKKLVSGS
ncbi:MAG: hypothetical protein IJL76_02325 [Bacilli bacterium]|nr:hypothetical protein [Bacilli bacterium]